MNHQEPLPFYKAFPIEPFLTESKWMEEEKKKMLLYLPAEYQAVQKRVEELCDEMEYDGSRMYDVHPDQLMIRTMAERVMPTYADDKERKYLMDITSCFLCNEILYRRYKKRRSKQYIK